MICKVVYNDSCIHFKDSIIESLKDTDVVIETLDEDYYKEKKKAISLKASCGTRLTPFVAFFNDDKELIHALYGETKDCTVENVKKYVL